MSNRKVTCAPDWRPETDPQPTVRNRGKGSRRVTWTDPQTGKVLSFVSAKALATYLQRVQRQALQDKRDALGKVKSAHDRHILNRHKGPVLAGKVAPVERTW